MAFEIGVIEKKTVGDFELATTKKGGIWTFWCSRWVEGRLAQSVASKSFEELEAYPGGKEVAIEFYENDNMNTLDVFIKHNPPPSDEEMLSYNN